MKIQKISIILLSVLMLIVIFAGISCSILNPTESTSFYVYNHCSSSIVLKSSAIVRYSDGPKTEYREFTISPNELLFLRTIGTTDGFTMSDIFVTFNVYSGNTLSSCSWINKSDWVLSSTNGKSYTYNVYSTCF